MTTGNIRVKHDLGRLADEELGLAYQMALDGETWPAARPFYQSLRQALAREALRRTRRASESVRELLIPDSPATREAVALLVVTANEALNHLEVEEDDTSGAVELVALVASIARAVTARTVAQAMSTVSCSTTTH